MSLWVERCADIRAALVHPDATPPAGRGPTVDVHKAWQAIHFLLCGEAWTGSGPAAFVLAGGTELGEDMGYGPTRGYSAAETKAIAEVLEGLDAEALVARWDPDAVAGAQLYGIEPSNEAEEKGFIAHYYAPMRELILAAAQADEGLLLRMV